MKATDHGQRKGKWQGKSKQIGEGKGIVQHTPAEMISLVQLLYSCGTNCMR